MLGQETVLWFSFRGSYAEPVQKTITPGQEQELFLCLLKKVSPCGWWTSLGSEGHEITSETLVRQSGPLVMYAKWIPEVYTVSFEVVRASDSSHEGCPIQSDYHGTPI